MFFHRKQVVPVTALISLICMISFYQFIQETEIKTIHQLNIGTKQSTERGNNYFVASNTNHLPSLHDEDLLSEMRVTRISQLLGEAERVISLTGDQKERLRQRFLQEEEIARAQLDSKSRNYEYQKLESLASILGDEAAAWYTEEQNRRLFSLERAMVSRELLNRGLELNFTIEEMAYVKLVVIAATSEPDENFKSFLRSNLAAPFNSHKGNKDLQASLSPSLSIYKQSEMIFTRASNVQQDAELHRLEHILDLEPRQYEEMRLLQTETERLFESKLDILRAQLTDHSSESLRNINSISFDQARKFFERRIKFILNPQQYKLYIAQQNIYLSSELDS